MFEKDRNWGQSIVLSEKVSKIIVGKGTHLRAIYCIEWKSKKTIVWKDYTLGQSIVLNERVSKSIVENNKKLKRTHVPLIPGLLTSWGGLEVDWKWIISGLQVEYKWIINGF